MRAKTRIEGSNPSVSAKALKPLIHKGAFLRLRCAGRMRRRAPVHVPILAAGADPVGPKLPPGDPMRHDLKVPFAEKDQAKKLGARWDAARKRWYIDGGLDPAVFARWQPAPHDASAAAAPAPASRRAAPASAEAKVQVGSRFVVLPRVCDCLPWEDCDACRLQAWPK